MNNSKQLTIFCATQSIWAKAKLSAVFSITNGRVIGLVDVRRRRFCWRFSFVVGAAIYIGGSNNKQQSYRDANSKPTVCRDISIYFFPYPTKMVSDVVRDNL